MIFAQAFLITEPQEWECAVLLFAETSRRAGRKMWAEIRIYDMRHIQTGPYLLIIDLSQGFRDVPVCQRLGHGKAGRKSPSLSRLQVASFISANPGCWGRMWWCSMPPWVPARRQVHGKPHCASSTDPQVQMSSAITAWWAPYLQKGWQECARRLIEFLDFRWLQAFSGTRWLPDFRVSSMASFVTNILAISLLLTFGG